MIAHFNEESFSSKCKGIKLSLNPNAYNTSLSYREHFIHYKVLEDIKYCSDLILIMTWFLNPKEFRYPCITSQAKIQTCRLHPRERKHFSSYHAISHAFMIYIQLGGFSTKHTKKEPHIKIHWIRESRVGIQKEEKILNKLTWWIFYN